MPRDEVLDLGARSPRASGSASRPGQHANAEAERYGEPCSSGGPSGSTCHHDCPAAASQSTKRYASSPRRPPGSEVGCSRTPLERSAKLHGRLLSRAGPRPDARCPPTPTAKTPPPRIRIDDVSRSSTAAATRPSARVGDRVDVSGDVFRDGHEILGAQRPLPAARATRAGARRRSSCVGNDRCAGAFEVDALGRWEFALEAWVDRVATWRDELRRKVEAGQDGPRERARRGRGAPRRRRARRRDGARLDGDRPSDGAVRSARRSSVDVDRALGALRRLVRALPALLRRLRGRRARCCPSSPSSASTSSTCRRSTRSARTDRKGRNNTLPRAARTTRAARGRSARREGGHDAIHPELGTLDDFDRLVARARRARARGRARLRDPVLARPPVADGASRVVPAPARRHDQVRREPAQEVPGHRQRRLGLRGLARRSGRRSATSSCYWIDHGVRIFRVDNPHTKPLPFWEWLIAEVRARRTPTWSSSPRRSRGRR